MGPEMAQVFLLLSPFFAAVSKIFFAFISTSNFHVDVMLTPP
jgi:hypothetical protein